jgi:hypothetical protein
MARSSKTKLVVAARCRSCGRPLSGAEGAVYAASYGRCCSSERRQKASAKLLLRPITSADFDGAYFVRQGR